jgi:hypothetical protein
MDERFGKVPCETAAAHCAVEPRASSNMPARRLPRCLARRRVYPPSPTPGGLRCACFDTPRSARADPIGTAAAVERDVTHAIGKESAKLDFGDRLNQDEIVTTQAASSARIEFLDQTQLNIGPTSQVKLDRFVYNPDRTAKTVTVDMLRGGFRFVTGRSDYNAYVLRTPHATIGVRGTVVGIFVEKGRTTVKLKQGGMTVCVRGARRCQPVEDLDDIVVVAGGRVSKPVSRKGAEPDFSLWCKGGNASCGLQ